jgi:hypothetical protein
MGNRIRYVNHPTKDDNKISIQKFTSEKTGATYKVVLDLVEMVYKIRNERTKEFAVKSKAYGNLNVLKRNARAHLVKLGVNLSTESRWRTFGICEKGYNQKKHEKGDK